MADNSSNQAALPRFDWAYPPPTLQQVIDLIASSTSSSSTAETFSGSGSPEGVVTASPGNTYWDATNDLFYVKDTGTATNTGWAIH